MQALEQVAVYRVEQHLERYAQQDERDDAVPVEVPVAVRALREEPGDEDEQRHVEEIRDIEHAAQHRVVVLDRQHEMRCHHQDDEQPLDVIEQRDAFACASHVIPRLTKRS